MSFVKRSLKLELDNFAENLFKDVCKLGRHNDLILFDIGYPSRKLIKFIESKDVKYLMKSKEKFLKSVMVAPMGDTLMDVDYKYEIIKIRVIKFELSSGITETLITNPIDDKLSINDFKGLYFNVEELRLNTMK